MSQNTPTSSWDHRHMASVYRELLEIEKSQMRGGWYTRAIDIPKEFRPFLKDQIRAGGRLHEPRTPQQIKALNSIKGDYNRVAAQTRGMSGHGAIPYTPGKSEDVLAGTPQDVAAIEHAMRRQGLRRRLAVQRKPGKSNIAASAGALGRGTGTVTIHGNKPPTAETLAHEIGHLSPRRRTVSRMMTINQDPMKVAREEARADAIAARMTGRNKVGGGYEQSAQAHQAAQFPKQFLRGRLSPVGNRWTRLNHAYLETLGTSLDRNQSEAYRQVRANMGNPVPSLY